MATDASTRDEKDSNGKKQEKKVGLLFQHIESTVSNFWFRACSFFYFTKEENTEIHFYFRETDKSITFERNPASSGNGSLLFLNEEEVDF